MTNLLDITNATDPDLDAILGMDDDTVWELLVMVENGDTVPTAAIRALSDADRVIFTEEYSLIATKNHRAAVAVRANAPRPAPLGINCPTGFCYHDAILARDERDQSRWT